MQTLKKYPALFRAAWASMVEYRAEVILWMLGSLWIVILMLVWLSVSEGGEIAGFRPADYVSYYMAMLLSRNLTAVWASWELDWQIRQGALSPKLLRPMHPVHGEITANLAEKGIRILIVLPVMTAVLLFMEHTPLVLTPLNLLLYALALAGAWAITFFLDYAIGVLGFWTSRSTSFVQMFFVLRMLFSGMLAPVAMFPAVVQDALRWLPFRYMLSLPVEILTGRLAYPGLLEAFAAQAAWVAIAVGLMTVLWRRGMRVYGAVGA